MISNPDTFRTAGAVHSLATERLTTPTMTPRTAEPVWRCLETNMRTAVFVLIAASLLPTTSVLQGQDDQTGNNRPKEAVVESIAKDLSPELRRQIAELLSKEIDRVTQQLESQREDLEQLRAKLKEQEGKLERSKLKLKFLKDRLRQWRPEDSQKPSA